MYSTEEFKDDEHFVEIFKKEHNEQFYVLVKMHLSFLLNMTTEESEYFYEKVKLKKRNLVPFGKKPKHKTGSGNEGTNLTQEGISQICQLINFIKEDKNLKCEGIFRRTGSVERQNELKNILLLGSSNLFENAAYTVHDCASVLKGILADLSEPLTTDLQFPIYCQIVESYNLKDKNYETKVLQCIQLLFLLLPKENIKLLKAIFDLLHEVTCYEGENKMSADNLAKLFTPHLLCPRKLAPEALLKDSQMLFGLVAFMIRKFSELFKIPGQLMLDFKTHYDQKNNLNESIKGAAHTVFTFVDNKLTAKENEENVTETALAQLYAHIQSLPESSKKRKLVKQFNKENGQGTPLQVIRSSMPKNKSIGDSIKKHMFHKKLMKNIKKSGFSQIKSASSEDLLNSPITPQKSSKGSLFCHNFDSSTDDEDKSVKRLKKSQGSPVNRPRSKSDSDLTLDVHGQYITSTPACRPHLNCGDEVFTPKCQDRESMSPITRSAQRMSRAMQETMMTPRSRKPVLLVSGTNINNLGNVSPKSTLTHLKEEETYISTKSINQNVQVHSLHSDHLQSKASSSINSTEILLEKSKVKFLDFKQSSDYSCNYPTAAIREEQSDYDSRRNTKRTFTKSNSDGNLTSSSKNTNKAPKINKTDSPSSLNPKFRYYLNSRNMLTFDSPMDTSFSSRSDDFQSDTDLSNENEHITGSFKENVSEINQAELGYKLSDSLLYVLDGNNPDNESCERKEPVLKPVQYDDDGNAIIYETSF